MGKVHKSFEPVPHNHNGTLDYQINQKEIFRVVEFYQNLFFAHLVEESFPAGCFDTATEKDDTPSYNQQAGHHK